MSTAVKRCDRCGVVLTPYNDWKDQGYLCVTCGIYIYDQQHGYVNVRNE